MFSPQSRLRHAVADTFAMVVYCSVVNMLIEIFLSGMSFEQSLSSRLVAIPVNIIIAALRFIPRCRHALRAAYQPRWLGEKPGRRSGLCDVPVAGLRGHSVDGGRGLAPDRGGGQFEYCDFNADGGGVWLFPRLLSPPV